MTPWEADLKKIEALPAADRANVMRWKMVTGLVVSVLPTFTAAAIAIVKWLS